MESNRHSIKAHRGETFTIDKIFKNKDGSPYIINNSIENLYLLISVVDSSYGKSDRFYRNYWLSLENYPRFSMSRPVDSSEIIGWSRDATFETSQQVHYSLYNVLAACTTGGTYDKSTYRVSGTLLWTSDVSKYANSLFLLEPGVKRPITFTSAGLRFNSMKYTAGTSTEPTNLYYDDMLVMSITPSGNVHWRSEEYMTVKISCISEDMYVSIGDKNYAIGPEFAVVKDGDEYLYWDNGWKPYECRFIKTFLSHDTKDWSAQQYSYAIQLAYGTKNRSYLLSLAEKYGIKYAKSASEDGVGGLRYFSNSELYEELCKLGHVFPSNYDPELPIWDISTVSLLPASELLILNYAQGGIY